MIVTTNDINSLVCRDMSKLLARYYRIDNVLARLVWLVFLWMYVNMRTSILLSTSRTLTPCIPKTATQEKYVRLLRDIAVPLVISVGSAGSGKTMFAASSALEYLSTKTVDQIILTRPTVNAGADLGALPGKLNDKMCPWIFSIYQHFYKFIGTKTTESLVKSGKITIAPLEFCRGRSFANSFVIADEMQNSTISQTKMLLTRLESDSKLVMTGDIEQTDIHGINGLEHFVEKYENYGEIPEIGVVKFTDEDIQRSFLTKKIYEIYRS